MLTKTRLRLTPELTDALAELVGRGMSVSSASAALCIPPKTALEWLARGEGRGQALNRPIYREFAAKIRAAQAGDVREKLARINAAARGGALKMRRTVVRTLADGTRQETTEEVFVPADWKADAWLLERTHRDQFGRQVPGDEGRTAPQVVVVLPDNGRRPGKSGATRLRAARRQEIAGGTTPQAPIEITGESAETVVSEAPSVEQSEAPTGGIDPITGLFDPELPPGVRNLPTIHAKHAKTPQERGKCPDCNHFWSKHRRAAGSPQAECCRGACPCTRSAE